MYDEPFMETQLEVYVEPMMEEDEKSYFGSTIVEEKKSVQTTNRVVVFANTCC